ncbi:hypothetical protein [Terriglobus sp.]
MTNATGGAVQHHPADVSHVAAAGRLTLVTNLAVSPNRSGGAQ